MTVKTIYQINYKPLYQKVVEYNICENVLENKKLYGIEIISKFNNSKESEKVENISSNKDLILKLIDYLYTNSVGVFHLKDVVDDYIFSIKK